MRFPNWKNGLIVLSGAILLLGTARASQAQYINGVSASTNMSTGGGTLLVNTVNGVGLSSLSLVATHNPTNAGNSWWSSPGLLTGNVTFNFNENYSLNGFSFWNQNGGGPGSNGTTGIKNVAVSTSLDGINFVSLAGAPTQFAQQLAGAVLPPEHFSFTPVNAHYARFTISSNWGDNAQTGFGEVAFGGVAVTPEPGALVTLVSGVMVVLGVLWRRRLRCGRNQSQREFHLHPRRNAVSISTQYGNSP